MSRERRPWRRCEACRGVCHWHDTAWVCDQCDSEWVVDHDPKFRAPGENAAQRWRAEVLALADELEAASQRARDRHHDPHVGFAYAEGASDSYDDAEQRVYALVARLDIEEAGDGA